LTIRLGYAKIGNRLEDYSTDRKAIMPDKPMNSIFFWWMSRKMLRRREHADVVLAGVGIKPGDVVLDFGAGPGAFSLAAAKLVGADGHVYALDIVPAAARKITNLAREEGITNITPITSDSATCLHDASIDIALLFDILHMLSQPDCVLGELHRVLKPGGRLAVNCHHWTEEQIVGTVQMGGLFALSGEDEYNYYFNRI
jgi:ubiquinone/menaquinone biosynthesis C-methylase UbiE